MKKNKLLIIWQIFLIAIFVFAFVHFFKDVTQDILKISTPLDIFGDVKEDLSFLPESVQKVYLYGLGGLSIVAEVFLLIAIPKVWKNKKFTKLDKWILASVVFLIIFFVTAIFLDPKICDYLSCIILLNDKI